MSKERLMLDYVKNQLWPQNIGGPSVRNLELWMANGDLDMNVVQNKVGLVRVAGSGRDLREGFHVKDAGFGPEIYVGNMKKDGGLRVVRDRDTQRW